MSITFLLFYYYLEMNNFVQCLYNLYIYKVLNIDVKYYTFSTSSNFFRVMLICVKSLPCFDLYIFYCLFYVIYSQFFIYIVKMLNGFHDERIPHTMKSALAVSACLCNDLFLCMTLCLGASVTRYLGRIILSVLSPRFIVVQYLK